MIKEAIQTYLSKTEEDKQDYAEAENYVESYLKSQHKEKKYGIGNLVKQILDTDNKMTELSNEYNSIRKEHYKSVDNHIAIGDKISKLVVSLNNINLEE